MQLQDKIKINPYKLEMNRTAAFYQYDRCCSVDICQTEKDISNSPTPPPRLPLLLSSPPSPQWPQEIKGGGNKKIEFPKPFKFVACVQLIVLTAQSYLLQL
jgi:hypothetical protein